MSKKLITIFILAFAIPLSALLWLGAGLSRDQQKLVEQQARELSMVKLYSAAELIHSAMRAVEGELGPALISPGPRLRDLHKRHPLVLQAFGLNSSGSLTVPDPAGELAPAERDFVVRTGKLWSGDALLVSAKGAPESVGSMGDLMLSGSGSSGDKLGSGNVNSGWIPWYWDDGLHLIYWNKTSRGLVVGAEVDPVVLISRLVAALPSGSGEEGLVCLVNEGGDNLYQWGAYHLATEEKPRVSLSLPLPMHTWRLDYFGGDTLAASLGQSRMLNFGLVFVIVLLAGGGLAFYFYRETGRDLREAGQRVNFVNQVSHELKTPLTNIRLYAELLEDKIDEEDKVARKQLGVIVNESRRLSRMIANVLAFSRGQRTGLKLRPGLTHIDGLIVSVLDHFGPSLKEKGIKAEHTLAAPEPIMVDEDALEQILANLIGNVEKYAAAGGWFSIVTAQDHEMTRVLVSDKGKGIRSQDAEIIFEPYTRLNDKLTEGVAGTGIGLSIARDLARLHGGDLRLVRGEGGAVFELSLPMNMKGKGEKA